MGGFMICTSRQILLWCSEHVVGFVGRTWRRGTGGRARNRREDNIKIDLKVLRCKGVDQDRHKWQAFVDTLRTFGLHKMRGKKETYNRAILPPWRKTNGTYFLFRPTGVSKYGTRISHDGHTSFLTVGKSNTRWSVLSTRCGTTGFSSS